MEGFNEQVVKRATKSKNIIIKIISVVLLVTLPVLCCILAYVITPYMIYLGLFIFLGGIYIVWYVFSSQKVEFEYSVAGDELDVSKVISLRKRKKVCKVNIREIEKLGKGESTVNSMRFSKTYVAARDVDSDDENYYAVFNSTAYGRCLLIFTPNEKILQGMKPNLNKEIVLKLFYNRNV